MKNIIIGSSIAFVTGILITIFCLHAVKVYKLEALVLANDAQLQEVIKFLNRSIEETQRAISEPMNK